MVWSCLIKGYDDFAAEKKATEKESLLSCTTGGRVTEKTWEGRDGEGCIEISFILAPLNPANKEDIFCRKENQKWDCLNSI